MHQTHLGRAVRAALTEAGWSQAELASRADIDQSGVNRIMNSARRPEINTLRAICTCWTSRATNVRILIEHLRDEVERAGHEHGTVNMQSGQPADEAAHLLALIRDHDTNLHRHLCYLITSIWDMLANRNGSLARAADGPGPTWPKGPRDTPRKK